jgi:hypothetical protein
MQETEDSVMKSHKTKTDVKRKQFLAKAKGTAPEAAIN